MTATAATTGAALARRKPEINGTLRNARRIAKGEDPRAPCLRGQVYGDTKGRFRDGEYITTSTIFGEDGDVFTTRYSAYRVESWADQPAATQPDEDAFMVPGMGAQPIPVKEWVAANDNEPVVEISDHYRGAVESWLDQERGQYIGLTRAVNQPPVDFQSDARNGDFIQTYTGKTFHPMDPRSQEVDIRDIAHSLSMQCRYAGHCRRFYSVAEHSTLIARWLVGQARAGRATREAAIYGLLHDASEAYLVDVPRPVKPYLTGYGEAELRVQAAVWARFGLYAAAPAIVKEADDRILADELVNMTRMPWHARHADPLGVPMMYWSPAEAEEEFLATYTALTGEVV